MNNTIFLIVGESGSGKTHIVSELEKRYNLKSIPSYTTRPKRHVNEHGHIFITKEEFAQLTNLCAYTEIQGCQYGATEEQVENNDLYVVDVAGLEYFKEHYNGRKEVHVIYINVPRVDRYLRMTNRGDSPDAALKRLQHDDISFSDAKTYANYIVTNRTFDKTVDDIWDYIQYHMV